MNVAHQQAIALSGLWQAANLVCDLANTAELDRQQHKRLSCSLNSVLVLEAESASQVYQPMEQLQFSMLGLHGFLKREHRGKPHAITYMMQLIRLQAIMSKDADMSRYIGSEIRRLYAQQQFLRDQQPLLIENLARIYSETFGSLSMRYRIKVRGIPEVLHKQQVQSAVRAILLAGVRAAMLWQQMGGSRLRLLFNKKQLEQALSQLLAYNNEQ